LNAGVDLAKTTRDRQALSLLFGRTECGRPYFLPPAMRIRLVVFRCAMI